MTDVGRGGSDEGRGTGWKGIGMRTAPRAAETPRPGEPAGRGLVARSRMVITRVQPWTVFKFSLLFYFCVMLIVLFGLLILYWVLGVIGVLDSAASTLRTIGFGDAKTGFQFHGFWIFSRVFLVGIVLVVIWSLVNMFLALVYNLVSDVVGGIEVTVNERR